MKKLNIGLLGTAAALAMALTIPALSHADAGKRGHGAHLIGMADADKSGDVSKAEFRAAAETRFAAMDQNGDGFVTKEEMEAAHAEMRARFEERRTERFAALDADGDGKVSLEEMNQAAEKRAAERGKDGLPERHAARMSKFFEKADADGDGALTAEELQAAKSKKHDGKKAEGMKDGKRGDRLARLDTDGDGKVSEAEFMARSDKMFEKLDRNDDGKIEHGEGRKNR